jgi:hypothetical protein
MSWWVGVEIDTGKDILYQLSDRNVTFNLSPMYRRALSITEPGVHIGDGRCRCEHHPGEHEMSLPALHGAPCTEAAGVISRARERMLSDSDTYKIMNPPNGWGSYEDAVDVLSWLLQECQTHPAAVVYVH